jgi:hypothetical protein
LIYFVILIYYVNLCFYRYLASGDLASSSAYNYRIGLSTCRAIVKETCQALWNALQPRYLSSPTKEDFRKIAEDFNLKWNLPFCLGAIDGKHFRVKCPPNSGSDYYNYKKYFSIILMAITDANYCFSFVDIGHVGSLNDSSIFRNCGFGKAIMDSSMDVPPPSPLPGTSGANAEPFEYYFVGDEAFALTSNLLIPYSKAQVQGRTEQAVKHKIFNYRLSRARRVVENSFGILAARWRLFNNTIQAHPDTAVCFIQAAVCLHNYLMKTKDIGVPNAFSGDTYINGERTVPGALREEVEQDAWERVRIRSNRNARKYPLECREYLCEYLNDVSSVPWQHEYATRGMY